MTRKELIKDLKEIIPTIVLDSLANLYKNKIIPSCGDMNILREDMVSLSTCLSETEEAINHNAETLNEIIECGKEQTTEIIDTLNNHAELLERLISNVEKLKRRKRK